MPGARRGRRLLVHQQCERDRREAEDDGGEPQQEEEEAQHGLFHPPTFPPRHPCRPPDEGAILQVERVPTFWAEDGCPRKW